MSSQNARPKWWQIYLTLPLLVVLFLADSRLKTSTRGHQAVQIGIILLVYGLIHWWLGSNARALSKMDRRQDHGTFTVIQIPAPEKHPSLHLSDSELKGLLSDTFEMGTIDAEALPVNEVPQELDKE